MNKQLIAAVASLVQRILIAGLIGAIGIACVGCKAEQTPSYTEITPVVLPPDPEIDAVQRRVFGDDEPAPAPEVVVTTTTVCDANVSMTLKTTEPKKPVVSRKYYVAYYVKSTYCETLKKDMPDRDADGNLVLLDKNPVLVVKVDGKAKKFRTTDFAAKTWEDRIDGEEVALPKNWEHFDDHRRHDSEWSDKLVKDNERMAYYRDTFSIFKVQCFFQPEK